MLLLSSLCLSDSNPAGPDAQVGSKREEERVEIACAKMGTSKTLLTIQNNESHRCDRLGKREAKDSLSPQCSKNNGCLGMVWTSSSQRGLHGVAH